VALSLPHHTVSATWHNVRLTSGNFILLKKIIKKIQNSKKIQKKSKKCWHVAHN